mgnify:CR=1 FL=1
MKKGKRKEQLPTDTDLKYQHKQSIVNNIKRI